MPSRRRVLASLGSVAALDFAGCLGPDQPSAGYVWRKGVRVEQQYSHDQFANTSVFDATLDSEEGVLRAEYDPEYVSFDESGTVVSAAVDDTLDVAFDDYWYYVNVDTGDGHGDPANGATDRQAFNDVTVGGRASAETYACPDRRDCVRVVDAQPRQVDVVDVSRFQFDVDEELARMRESMD